MHPQEIVAGRFYVKRDGNEVRQVLNMSNGNIFWQGYDFRTGKPLGTFSCSVAHLAQWAGRELTAEERQRMQVDTAMQQLTKEEEKAIDRLMNNVNDQRLLEEVKKRGLQAE